MVIFYRLLNGLALCKNCVGCSELERPNFEGKQECDIYYFAYTKDEMFEKRKTSLKNYGTMHGNNN